MSNFNFLTLSSLEAEFESVINLVWEVKIDMRGQAKHSLRRSNAQMRKYLCNGCQG